MSRFTVRITLILVAAVSSFQGSAVNASLSVSMLVSSNSLETVYSTPGGTNGTSKTQASSIQSGNIAPPSPSTSKYITASLSIDSFLSRSSTDLIVSADRTGSQTSKVSSPGTTPSLITSMSTYYTAFKNSSSSVNGSPDTSPSYPITPSSFVKDMTNFTSQAPNVQSYHPVFSTWQLSINISAPERSSTTAQDQFTRNRTVFISSHFSSSQSRKNSSFSPSTFFVLPSSDSISPSPLSVSHASPKLETASISSIRFSSLGKVSSATGQPSKSETSDQSVNTIPNSLPGSVTVTVNNSSASSIIPSLNTSSSSLGPSLTTSAVPPRPTLPAAGIRYVGMKITIDMTFEEVYNDKESSRYKTLVANISAQLKEVYEDNVPGFIGIRILFLQKGSVICSYLVLLAKDSEVENKKLKEVLEKASKAGKLGFKVKSVEVDESDKEEEKPQEKPLPKWALITIIVLGSLTVVLLVALIIVCVRHRRFLSASDPSYYISAGELPGHAYDTLPMGDYKMRANEVKRTEDKSVTSHANPTYGANGTTGD